jgi:hypothetical protein
MIPARGSKRDESKVRVTVDEIIIIIIRHMSLVVPPPPPPAEAVVGVGGGVGRVVAIKVSPVVFAFSGLPSPPGWV